MTAFLDTWLNDGDELGNGWVIVRLGDEDMGRWDGKRGRWVGWVGWKE
jgi:hypothetical protein